MALSDNEFLNGDFNFNDFISQAPTPPPPPSLSEDSDFAGIDIFDFQCQNLDEIDFQLTGSQTITFGQISSQPQAEVQQFPQPQAEIQQFPQPVVESNNKIVIKNESVDSVVSSSAVLNNKCMNRNAIAARQNRAKKKTEFERVKTDNAFFVKENERLTKENKELRSKNLKITQRLVYFEKYFRDNVRMNSYHSLANNEKYKLHKKQSMKKPPENPVGICLYISPDKEMEFRMCEYCAGPSGRCNIPSALINPTT